MFTASAYTQVKQDRTSSDKKYIREDGLSSRFYKLKTTEIHKSISTTFRTTYALRGFVLSSVVAELKITNPTAYDVIPDVTSISAKLKIDDWSNIIDERRFRYSAFKNYTGVVSPDIDMVTINGIGFKTMTFAKPISALKMY